MAKPGRCEFSGMETKGGKFAPGGDAKLKSALSDALKAGDTHAGAEAVHRGWMDIESVPDEHRAQVEALVAHENVADWLADRLNARWSQIESGVEPRQAVSALLAQADLAKAAAKEQAKRDRETARQAKAQEAADKKAEATANAQEADVDPLDEVDEDLTPVEA